jgi:hypothetical protein
MEKTSNKMISRIYILNIEPKKIEINILIYSQTKIEINTPNAKFINSIKVAIILDANFSTLDAKSVLILHRQLLPRKLHHAHTYTLYCKK